MSFPQSSDAHGTIFIYLLLTFCSRLPALSVQIACETELSCGSYRLRQLNTETTHSVGYQAHPFDKTLPRWPKNIGYCRISTSTVLNTTEQIPSETELGRLCIIRFQGNQWIVFPSVFLVVEILEILAVLWTKELYLYARKQYTYWLGKTRVEG